jgi:hypothetical protein
MRKLPPDEEDDDDQSDDDNDGDDVWIGRTRRRTAAVVYMAQP